MTTPGQPGSSGDDQFSVGAEDAVDYPETPAYAPTEQFPQAFQPGPTAVFPGSPAGPTTQFPGPAVPTTQFPGPNAPTAQFPAGPANPVLPPQYSGPAGSAYPPPSTGFPPSGTGFPPSGSSYPPPMAMPPASGYPSPYGNFYDPYGPQTPGTNGMAIASLVTAISGALFGWVLCFFTALIPAVGSVLGIVALNQIKRTGQEGKALAIAGIVIGALATLAYLGFFLFILIAASSGGFDSSYSSI